MGLKHKQYDLCTLQDLCSPNLVIFLDLNPRSRVILDSEAK